MRLTGTLYLAGLALLTAGAMLVYLPAGFIVGGVALVSVAYLSARGS